MYRGSLGSEDDRAGGMSSCLGRGGRGGRATWLVKGLNMPRVASGMKTLLYSMCESNGILPT